LQILDSGPLQSMAKTKKAQKLRIVLKFGTGVLTEPGAPTIDGAQVWNLLRQVAELRSQGHSVIIVTSGAVAAGIKTLGLEKRPKDMASLQACAAVGQSKLMHHYEQVLLEWGLHVGQMLVTHEDFELPGRRSHIQNTLERLLEAQNVVPVFNENDSVAIEEIRFGDNDALSSSVAVLARADVLILLTSVDGLLPPKSAEIVKEVHDIESVMGFARNDKGEYSVGGMASKLQAVKRAVDEGVLTIIANGRRTDQLALLPTGKGIGTRFFPKKPRKR
jgi:glutamate 5-kinase